MHALRLVVLPDFDTGPSFAQAMALLQAPWRMSSKVKQVAWSRWTTMPSKRPSTCACPLAMRRTVSGRGHGTWSHRVRPSMRMPEDRKSVV